MQENPPQVALGDWIEIVSSPSWLMPLDGAIAKVTHADGTMIGIVAGRLATSLDWSAGDRWKPSAAPAQMGIAERFLAGERSAAEHSWLSRPAATHALAVGREDYDGWLAVSGDPAVEEIVSASRDAVMEDGDPEAWVEYADPAVADRLEPETLARALALGRLVAEADCMNDGFVLHHFGNQIELRMSDEQSLRGLEALIEGYERLGFTLAYK